MSILNTMISPFQFEFMRNAFVISLLIAVPTALLSCFLVLKGWALMGDAIAHAIFPGVVLAYLTGIPLAIGAFIAGMVCALATGFLKDNSRIKQDTVMGVVFSGMFGLGLVIYVKIQSDVHLDHILFGNMLGINSMDILESGLIAAFVGGIIVLKQKDFFLHAFDPTQAKVVGLPLPFLHYSLLCLISLTIVGALTAVGTILVISLLIAPGAIAFLLTRVFSRMLWLSVVIASSASFLGVYVSFFIDSEPAPTIVLLMTLLFVAVFLFTSWKNTITVRAEIR